MDITEFNNVLGVTEISEETAAFMMKTFHKLKMDNQDKAIIDASNYDKNGQGDEMVLPIIGSEFTGLDRSEKQLLELISSLIKIHYTQMRGNIKIVIYKDFRNVISIASLQKDTEK